MLSFQLNAVPLASKKGYPHIVACGNTPKDIRYFCIQLENLVFNVS